MVSWLPSIPYPGQRDGYWSPITSTLNWCEEDYYATHYVAELINSFTNLEFIYFGIKGLRNSFRNDDDAVFKIAWVAYILMGTGSFAFHATLLYPMQLFDELAMIYMTSILLYAAFSYNLSSAFRILLGLAVTGLSIFVTVYYHHLGNPVFHETVFALMTAAVVFRSFYIIEKTLRPSTKKNVNGGVKSRRSDAVQARRHERDVKLRKTTYAMTRLGLGTVAIGFVIWNLDTIYCSTWRRLRHQIGLPWGILLEGHGWWHVFTGVSGYTNIIWSTWNRYCLQGRQDEFELLWPSWWVAPTIERVDEKRRIKKG